MIESIKICLKKSCDPTMTLNGLSAYNLSLCFTHNNAISVAFPFLDHKSWFFLPSIHFFICLVMMFCKQNYRRWYWTHKGSICVTIIFSLLLLLAVSDRRHDKQKQHQTKSKVWGRGCVCFLDEAWDRKFWSVPHHNNLKQSSSKTSRRSCCKTHRQRW